MIIRTQYFPSASVILLMEEKELAIRCARKDKVAQQELYEEYGSRILALCRRYAVDQSDAEDMMQDSFIKIFKVIGNFKWTRPGSLYSWMARVTINHAFDSSKRRRTLTKQLVDIDQLGDIAENQEYEESAPVPADVLHEMIEALPEGYRTVFKLYCIDGLSHKEITDLLRIKEKSSSASLARARALLSEAIRQYWRDMENGASPEGWSKILRKMHQRAVFRNVILLFAFLIPSATLLLWHMSRPTYDMSTPYVSQITVVPPSVIVDDRFLEPERLMDRLTVVNNEDNIIISEDIEIKYEDTLVADEDGIMSGMTEVIPNEVKESQAPSDEVEELFGLIQTEIHRSRPKLSFSLRAGSGTSRRNTDVYLESAPYIAALTYMNAVNPDILPDSKSNSSNALPWYASNYIPTAAPETKSSSPNANNFTPASTNNYHHNLPVTFGLSAHMGINNCFGAESGIEYTYMNSNIETVIGQLTQNLHFIGIPVRFDYRALSWQGLDMYIGVSAKAEKCIAASIGHVRCEEKRLQWSAGAFAGIQYQLGKYSHLYLQPELSYYFTETDLITYRTENPCIFSLNAGLRFDL